MNRPTRTLRLAACAVLSLLTLGCASTPKAFEPGQPTVLLNHEGVAIRGYDPVAYFVDGQAKQGRSEWRAMHEGATYFFSSAENREAFVADPERFVPAYGGYCAWAVSDGEGSLVEVDPQSYLVQDGRLLLFYDGLLADTRAFWMKRDVTDLARSADENWKRIAGSADD